MCLICRRLHHTGRENPNIFHGEPQRKRGKKNLVDTSPEFRFVRTEEFATQMDGWMDGREDGWTGGWMDRRMVGWMGGWMDG